MDSQPNSSRVQDQSVVPPMDMPTVPDQAPDSFDHYSLFDSTMGSNEGDLLNPIHMRRIFPDKKEIDQPKV